MGIEKDLLKKRLISKRLEFKEQQENRRIEQRFTIDKAIFSRDALAKGIYTRLFDYLIQVGVGFSSLSINENDSFFLLDNQ